MFELSPRTQGNAYKPMSLETMSLVRLSHGSERTVSKAP